MRLMVAAALVAASIVSAQDINGTIRGTVMHGVLRTPIPEVTVLLTSSPNAGLRLTTVTDSQGQFRFGAIPAGVYEVEARLNVYLSVNALGRYGSAAQTLSISAARPQQDLTFRMIRSGAISGRVLNPEGGPAVGGTATAMEFTWQEGLRVLNPVQSVQIDDRGEYRLYRLPPGRYVIAAEPRERESTNIRATPAGAGQSVAVPVRTFFPGRDDVAAAAAVVLQEGGETTGVSFSLRSARTFRISGTVASDLPRAARPPMITLFQLVRRDGEGFWDGSMATFSNSARPGAAERGEFEIRGVSPGSYDVYPVIRERPGALGGRARVQVGSQDVSGITVILRRNPVVRIRLVSGASVLGQGLERIAVRLIPQELLPVLVRQPIVASVTMQQDGAYLFPSVPEGRYALRLSGAPADVYAAGFRLNGKPLPEAIFDVGSEGLKSPLEIVLSPGAGSIRGTVSDSLGTPVPQALVALVPSKAQPRVPLFSLDTRTDSTGSFVLQNIAPGEYTLFAWEHAQSSSWQDPDFLRIVEPVGRRVVVTSAPQTDVQLTAIPGEPLP